MLATMLLILAFPTLGSAMTGYTPKSHPYIPDDQGFNIPYEKYGNILYVIHDGDRINKTKDLVIMQTNRTDFKYPYTYDDLGDIYACMYYDA